MKDYKFIENCRMLQKRNIQSQLAYFHQVNKSVQVIRYRQSDYIYLDGKLILIVYCINISIDFIIGLANLDDLSNIKGFSESFISLIKGLFESLEVFFANYD